MRTNMRGAKVCPIWLGLNLSFWNYMNAMMKFSKLRQLRRKRKKSRRSSRSKSSKSKAKGLTGRLSSYSSYFSCVWGLPSKKYNGSTQQSTSRKEPTAKRGSMDGKTRKNGYPPNWVISEWFSYSKISSKRLLGCLIQLCFWGGGGKLGQSWFSKQRCYRKSLLRKESI